VEHNFSEKWVCPFKMGVPLNTTFQKKMAYFKPSNRVRTRRGSFSFGKLRIRTGSGAGIRP
jgi:hypothetical protein